MATEKREVAETRKLAFPDRRVPQKPKQQGEAEFQPPPPRQDPRKPTVRVMEEEPQPRTKIEVQPTRDLSVEKNSSYIDVTLPSNFYFYSFKSLAVRFFKAPDQAKCIRAAKEGRFRHLVEAISATLQPGISAYDLTHQDFYFLMYWHRMNSFSKTPYNHRTLCENPDHISKVMLNEMEEKTLEISTLITTTSLKEVQLDPEKIIIPPSLAEKYQLGTVLIKDMVEIEEMEDSVSDFPDIEFLADLACYLKPQQLPNGGAQSLKDRIEIVKEMTPDEVEEMQTYIRSVSDYGVTENVVVKCRGCGAEREAKVSIDALAFLPTPR